MLGSSLWLVPPEDSTLYQTLQALIQTGVPALYPIALPVHFTPHVTLTADTLQSPWPSSPYAAQAWLDNLPLSDEQVQNSHITLHEVAVGEIFFRKLAINCETTPALVNLAARCRARALLRERGGGEASLDDNEEEEKTARDWVEKNYAPHCSLMYSDLPSDEVRNRLRDVTKTVREAKAYHPESIKAKGGSIWIVPTEMSIEEWRPIAIRSLPDIEWAWET